MPGKLGPDKKAATWFWGPWERAEALELPDGIASGAVVAIDRFDQPELPESDWQTGGAMAARVQNGVARVPSASFLRRLNPHPGAAVIVTFEWRQDDTGVLHVNGSQTAGYSTTGVGIRRFDGGFEAGFDVEFAADMAESLSLVSGNLYSAYIYSGAERRVIAVWPDGSPESAVVYTTDGVDEPAEGGEPSSVARGYSGEIRIHEYIELEVD